MGGLSLIMSVALCTGPAVGDAGIVSVPAGKLRRARDNVADEGLDVQIFGTFDFSLAALGRQQRTGAWVARGLIDGTATFDGEKVLGWRGGTVHFGLQSLIGQSGVPLLDDLQTFDNIDADPFVGLTEGWVQQEFLSGRVRIKLGRVDVNNEFASVEEGALEQAVRARRTLIHSSPGFSPTIVRMPSYPLQSLGGLIDVAPLPWLKTAAGVYDASHQPSPLSSAPDPSPGRPFSTSIVIAEIEAGWRLGVAARSGRLGVGGWGLFGDEACDANPCARRTAGGAYVVASQTVWRRPGTMEGVGIYGQYGWAPAYASFIRQHAGTGVVWTGVLRRRPDDMIGAGYSWIGLRGNPVGETALELFYRGAVHHYVWMQPDLQYIVRPGGERPDGVVVTLRIAIDL